MLEPDIKQHAKQSDNRAERKEDYFFCPHIKSVFFVPTNISLGVEFKDQL